MGAVFGRGNTFTLDHELDDVPFGRKDSYASSISTIPDKRDLAEDTKEQETLIETPAEKKARKRSHLVAYATMFVMSVGFSIVLTGVYPYMKQIDNSLDKTALGLVVAANPFGQMIASPLLGFWGYKMGSIRLACITTIICFIIGNVFYSLLSIFNDISEHSAYYFMIFFRFLVGVSSANVTLCRSYLAQSTTLKERTAGIAIIAASQALGFVVGPAIQAILALSIKDGIDTGVDWLVWDKYTAAGWIAALLGFVNLVLMMPCVFQEFDLSKKERARVKANNSDIKVKLPPPNWIGLVGILFAFYLALFIFVLIETLSTPFVMDQYAWTPELAMEVVGAALSVGGILSMLGFALSTFLSKRYDERLVLVIAGFVPLIIGTFLFIPLVGGSITMMKCNETTDGNETTTIAPDLYLSNDIAPLMLANLQLDKIIDYDVDVNPYEGADLPENCEPGCPEEQTWCLDENKLEMPQLIVAFVIVIVSYPIASSVPQAIFSKMLGPKPQGIWMGVLTGVGSLSRVTGPIFVSYIYTEYGTTVTFSIMTGAMGLALIELIILYRYLVPMKIPELPKQETKIYAVTNIK